MPTLYSVAKTGKVVTIQYHTVQEEDGSVSVVNIHGQLDGLKITDKTNIKIGKNIGKANETSVVDQANSEMESKWKSKLDKNYTENESGIPDAAEKSLLPMLAQKFNDKKHKIKYPCMTEPKVDGLRSLARLTGTTVEFTSRMYKPYTTLSHLATSVSSAITKLATLYKLPIEDIILDGEIYLHNLTLQEINRRVKKHRGPETEELKFHVYDIAIKDIENELRNEMVSTISEANIVPVVSDIAKSESDVKVAHDKYVKDGYEGVIIRNLKGLYLFDKRSDDLQKYKEFIDDEFEIINITSGEGRETGAIIYVCKVKSPLNNHNGEFAVRPKGTIEDRIQLMKDSKKLIGKKLTVRYQELTEDGIPSFPIGIAVRLDQDLPK
jgi:DNA ligase-1